MNPAWMILLRATVLLSICGLATTLFRRRGASVRHAIWTAGLVMILLLPVTEVLTPKFDMPVLPNADILVPDEVALFADAQSEGAFDDTSPPTGAGTPEPSDGARALPRWDLTRWLWASWICGVFVMLVRLALGSVVLSRLRYEATSVVGGPWGELLDELKAHFSVGRPVSLCISPGTPPPMTWGIRKHVIILPSEADEWPRAKQRLVLAHELAHVKRQDGLAQALIQLALTAYWFHPLVWYAARRSRIEREQAADAEVLTLDPDHSDYADHLLATVGRLHAGLAFAAVSIARPSELDGRLSAILGPLPGRAPPWIPRAVALSAVALTIILSVVTLTRRGPWEFPDPVEVASQVLMQETGTPVPSALVRLGNGRPTDYWARAGESVPELGRWLDALEYEVQSDAAGQFTFAGVTPYTHYFATVQAAGFLPAARPQVVTISGDGSLGNDSLALTPQATVSGRVLDMAGTGVPDIGVGLLALTYRGGDRLRARTSGQPRLVITNESGEYQIGAPPGDYLVWGRPSRSRSYPNLPGSFTMPLYNPGVFFPDQGTVIAVEAGDQIANVDLRFPDAEYHRITLTVTTDSLPDQTDVQFRIRPLTEGLTPPVRPLRFDRVGGNSYQSPWVTPGVYQIAVWATPVGRPINDLATEISELTVTVVDRDVETGVVLGPPPSMPTRIVGLPDSSPLANDGLFRIQLSRVWPPGTALRSQPVAGTDDEFEIPGVSAGRYSLTVWGLPVGYYVERILYGGADVSFWEVDIVDPSQVLEVRLAAGAGTIGGTVRNAAGDPVPLAVVVLAADTAPGDPNRFLERTQAGLEGEFAVAAMPPGDYLAYAAEIYQNQSPTPQWLDERSGRLVSVTVEAGEQTLIDVPLLDR